MLHALLKIDAYIDSYSKLRLARAQENGWCWQKKSKRGSLVHCERSEGYARRFPGERLRRCCGQRELLGDRHLNRQASLRSFHMQWDGQTGTSTVHDGDGGPLSGVTEGMHCIWKLRRLACLHTCPSDDHLAAVPWQLSQHRHSLSPGNLRA